MLVRREKLIWNAEINVSSTQELSILLYNYNKTSYKGIEKREKENSVILLISQQNLIKNINIMLLIK